MSQNYYNNPFFTIDQLSDCTDFRTAEELDASMPDLPDVCGMRTYAEGRLLGLYQTALADAIQTGRVPINRGSPLSRPVLTSSWLKRLECFRCEDSRSAFYLDAVMVAEIDLHSASTGKQHVRQWYRIRGQMDFDGNRLEPVQTILVYDRKDRRKEPALTEWLIPVIAKRDLDAEARRILTKYDCGETVNPRELAAKMHLKVLAARLSPTARICGELFLHDTVVRVYPKDSAPCEMEVSAGTILYDPDACRTKAGIEETIVHECLHCELHRLFYSLQREYTDAIRFLSCMDSRFSAFAPDDTFQQWMDDQSYDVFRPLQPQTQTSRSAMEWAEWQVRELTPRVMMPAEQTRRKIDQLTARLRRSPSEPLPVVYSRVIPALASFYHVSWTTAKIRMLELGFEEARGVLCYTDGAYLPPYAATPGTLSPGVTFRIGREDARRLYTCDLQFRAVADSGLFLFAEGHYCLNHPRFLQVTPSGPALTPYARAHIEQCCVQFQLGYHVPGRRHDRHAPHSDRPAGDPIALALSSLPLEAFHCMADQLSIDCSKLPRELGQTLVYHRKARGLTQDGFAELLGVDHRTIRRIENGEDDSPSQQAIAFLALKLGLPGVYTEDLLNKAGRPLLRDTRQDMELKFVIHFMYTRPMEEINEVLTSHGCKPLKLGGRQRLSA